MKIAHIVPSSTYTDYWGYQDNLLPKYHSKLGHEATVIAMNQMHIGEKIVDTECSDYVLDDGVRVIRLDRKRVINSTVTELKTRMRGVYEKLCELKPDFIFFHGLVSETIYDVIKYKKRVNPACVIVQDNHLDYNIGRKFNSLKDKVVRLLYRCQNRKSIKYVDKIYGVTPWRKKYAEDYFKIPEEKTDVLIMGADDEKIDFANREQIRSSKRAEYGIKDDEFLIVTGGKIDKKKKIDTLMRACSQIQNVKLLVFGNVLDDVKSEFDSALNNSNNIIYIGWIDADKVYDYFFAADLVFFPGQHSVLWEQACASKVPCVFGKWVGMDHVNNGGNSDFVENITEASLREKINELHFTAKYFEMKSISESEATDVYLYSNIAKKSLECIMAKK